MRARILLATFLFACSPARPQTVEIPSAERPDAGAIAKTHEQASRPQGTSSPACPPSYSGAIRPTCKPGDDPGTCSYAEGTCTCGRPPMCGGAPRPSMPPTWICEAPRTPCPRPGTPCQGSASCHDGPCSWQDVVQCQHGVWTAVATSPPP